MTDPSVLETFDEQEVEARRAVLRHVGSAGIPWESVVRVGSPGEEIVKEAEAKA
jgi:hypothetical protein